VFFGDVGRLSFRSKRGESDRVAGAPRYVPIQRRSYFSFQRVGDNSLHFGSGGPLAGAHSYGMAERQRAGGLRGRRTRAAGGSKMRVGRVLLFLAHGFQDGFEVFGGGAEEDAGCAGRLVAALVPVA